MSTPFDDATAWIKEGLDSTGFKRKDPVAEPELPVSLEDLAVEQLKRLYDAYLAYYVFIAGELVMLHGVRDIAKEYANVARAQTMVIVASKYSNADTRKAAVECDPSCTPARLNHIKIQGLFRAQEERRKTASKVMDRIGRELFYQTGKTYYQDSSRNKGSKPWRGHERVQEQTEEMDDGTVSASKRRAPRFKKPTRRPIK